MKNLIYSALALTLAAALPSRAAEFTVNPKSPTAQDANPGTPDKPLQTLAKALQLAQPGDTITLATADYPAVSITQAYDKPLTIKAAPDARPVMLGGLALRKAAGLRISGLTFTWSPGKRPTNPMTPFLEIANSKDVEIAACEIFDDPTLSEWAGWACSVNNSEQVTVRDTKAHHFYFGFSAYRSKDVIFRNLTIGPWTHEDGIRFTECEGPVMADGCRIGNTGIAGKKGGHVDAIQVVHWTDNLTIRNCYLQGMGQGIGAFGDRSNTTGRRRKNWRIEGNVIFDVYAPHACTICQCDGVTVINNTLPLNRPLLIDCTAAVVKNNIFGLPSKDLGEADYNLWITGPKVGEHDLTGDPKFVNIPLLSLKSDSGRAKEMTRSKFFFRETLKGRLAVGDKIEVANSDGTGRDGVLRKIVAIGDNWLEIDTPLANDPDFGGVSIFKWPVDHKNLAPDYHLKADSPAIDSADSAVKRAPDMDGHPATDAPTTANTGAGEVIKYLDRGALEFVPPKETK